MKDCQKEVKTRHHQRIVNSSWRDYSGTTAVGNPVIYGLLLTSSWFQPLLKKYICHTGSSPQVEVKMKHVWNHHLGYFLWDRVNVGIWLELAGHRKTPPHCLRSIELDHHGSQARLMSNGTCWVGWRVSLEGKYPKFVAPMHLLYLWVI